MLMMSFLIQLKSTFFMCMLYSCLAQTSGWQPNAQSTLYLWWITPCQHFLFKILSSLFEMTLTVQADHAGTVVEILVEDGKPVGIDQVSIHFGISFLTKYTSMLTLFSWHTICSQFSSSNLKSSLQRDGRPKFWFLLLLVSAESSGS